MIDQLQRIFSEKNEWKDLFDHQVSGNLVSGLDEVTSKCKKREGLIDKCRKL